MKLEEAMKEILQDLQELKNISQYREKQEIETLSKKILELYKTVLQEIERLQKDSINKEKIMKYKKEAENAECKSALEAVCIGAIIGVLDGLLEE